MKLVYTAQQIVDEALAGVRDFERNRAAEAQMYFLRGYREFNLFHSMTIKQSWEPVTPIKTVTFPDDYLNFVSIGVQLNAGIFTFTKEAKSTSPSDPLGLVLNEDRNESESVWKNIYGYASNSANDEGYFMLDPAHDRIVLKDSFWNYYANSTRSEVLLSYVSDGIGDDLRNTYIPTTAANLLIAYVEYKLVASMPEKYPANYRQDKLYEYQLEQEKFDILALPSVDELYDAIFSTSGQLKR